MPETNHPAADIDNFTITSDNTYVAGLWRGYYAGISRTNTAINDLPKISNMMTPAQLNSSDRRNAFFTRIFLF